MVARTRAEFGNPAHIYAFIRSVPGEGTSLTMRQLTDLTILPKTLCDRWHAADFQYTDAVRRHNDAEEDVYLAESARNQVEDAIRRWAIQAHVDLIDDDEDDESDY